jgi:hypothetical protein
VLNQKHLRQLLNEYIRYYHEDRTHLGLGRTLLVVGLRRQRLLVVTRLFHYRDSVGYITATRLRPNKSAAMSSTRSLACLRVESGSRLDLGSPLVSGTLRAVGDHACKALGFKKDASCIDASTTRRHLVLMSRRVEYWDA